MILIEIVTDILLFVFEILGLLFSRRKRSERRARKSLYRK